MAGQQIPGVVEKQVEDISLKVTILRKITSIKASLVDGQIYQKSVREIEGQAFLIKVGEKETLLRSKPQEGDNSDSTQYKSRQEIHFTPYRTHNVIPLTDDIELQFSIRSLQKDSTISIKTDPSEGPRELEPLSTAELTPDGDQPNYEEPDSKSSRPSWVILYGDSEEASSLKKVRDYTSSEFYLSQNESTQSQTSFGHVVDYHKEAVYGDVELVSSRQDHVGRQSHSDVPLQSYVPEDKRIPSKSHDGPMFDEASETGEVVVLPEVDTDSNEDIQVDDTEFGKKDLKTVSESNLILSQTPASLNSKRRKVLTEKIWEHRCIDCYARFPLRKLYQKHNEGVSELICEICSAKFSSQCKLRQHCHKHCKHIGKDFLCQLCNNQFSTKLNFLRHNCHGHVACRLCNKSFLSQNALNMHIKAHHKNANTCDTCHKIFSCSKSLRRHSCSKSAHAVRLKDGKFKCLTCVGQFHSLNFYIKHRNFSDKNMNRCWTCGKLFQTPCALVLHSYNHNPKNEGKLVCPECKGEFKNRYLYTCHRQYVQGKGYACSTMAREVKDEDQIQKGLCACGSSSTVRCVPCGLRFHGKYWLRRHLLLKSYSLNKMKDIKSHNKRQKICKSYICEACGMTYSSLKIMSSHFLSHQEQMNQPKHLGVKAIRQINVQADAQTNIVKCPSCHKEFTSKNALNRHALSKFACALYSNGTIEPFFCPRCNKVYTTKTSIFRHKVYKICMHFSCEICGKRFSTQKILSSHILTHQEQTDDGKYHCNVCNKTYNRRTGYLKHKRKVKCDISNLVKCSLCGGIFANEKALNLHKKFDHGEGESYFCDICQKGFTSSKAVSRHKAMNKCDKSRPSKTSEYIRKSSQCDTCGKIFSCQSNLSRHMRKHSGEKPYVCNECGKGFVDSFVLKSHIQNIHVGTRSFLCQICGKSFKTHAHLDRHTLGHTEKNFHCSFCRKKYKYAKTLQEHQNKVHASKLPKVDLQKLGLV